MFFRQRTNKSRQNHKGSGKNYNYGKDKYVAESKWPLTI